MNTETANREEDGDDLIVVGIGASAGGLEALETMFAQMPSDGGMAFVIVQHLSPDFKSLMVELLGRHTAMPVHRVTDSMVVEANSLYLIPPKRDMVIRDGRLLLTERKTSKSPALPIDHFFKSLASEKGANSIGIVLSGTGSDGSQGIQYVHESGGLVMVQTPSSAKFDGMPKSAIDSEHVDVVTTPDRIPGLLTQYSVHRDRVALRHAALPAYESAMERILRAIQKRHRVDFSDYRATTIGRRIERRIEMERSVDTFLEYADLIESDFVELDHLHHDLLIGVTGFFRDVQPFNSLKENALNQLLAEHPVEEEFRVWVAACATGEEAYSVAMLIDECLRDNPRRLDIKIFATDVHRSAINRATVGIYSAESLEGISEQRRKRYFVEVDGGYQIVPDIRRMVVFAPHNLVKDPPFTRLSLVTCRNFLIYLVPAAQTRVIAHFHFALKKNGILLLGSSESPGELASEFEPVDAASRLYRKTQDARSRPPLFADTALGASSTSPPAFPLPPVVPRVQENPLELRTSEILSTLVPPGLVVDRHGQVLQVFRNAGRYLRVSDGLLSSNLMDLVDEDLRLAIGGAMQRSTKRCEPVCYERIQIKTAADEVHQVRLTVTPLPKGDVPKKFVITFEQLSGEFNKDSLARQTRRLDLDEISKGHLEDLEQELQHNREILQATTEEMETSNEELQSTNEELVASNEELQSANEELHSVNEELYTVNGEYQKKISELTELTHDFDNLLESTEIHTLFLDDQLCIRKFTPRMADVLHLVPHDMGRRIDAFVHNINSVDLSDKILQVLETGESYEERIEGGGDTEYLMRVLPYHTGVEISGVVLTLIDISGLAAAQRAVTLERERFERAIQANRDGTWDWPDLTRQEMWWSSTCYQILGYEPGAFPPLHSEWLRLIHPEDREQIEQSSVPASDRCYVALHQNFEYRMMHSNGTYRWYCHRAIVDHDENGKPIRMTGSIADVQERKISEVQANEDIRARDNFLSMLSHELRNPMGAVMNALTNLDDEASASPKLKTLEEFAVIKRQTRQMARLLDDLLDVAKFGQDRIEFRKEIVDLCELVNSVIESVDYQLEEKRQFLRTSICEGPLNIIGDPTRISQAQTNLIVNASKFSDVDQEISYTVQRTDTEAVITVEDQGAGIPAHLLERVFDLFMQSEATLDRSAGGMGVGLSLTKKIISAHNGVVTAESQGPGQGSRFQIRLPLSRLTHQKREKTPVFDQSLVCRILLVEDNVDAREMLARTLRRRGFEVETAGDGKSALTQLSKFEPAVAVVDIGLPGMSGFELAEQIRSDARWNDVMLVALTGYGQKDDREAVADAGFSHHIVKPLIFENLHELIIRHLTAARQS